MLKKSLGELSSSHTYCNRYPPDVSVVLLGTFFVIAELEQWIGRKHGGINIAHLFHKLVTLISFTFPFGGICSWFGCCSY